MSGGMNLPDRVSTKLRKLTDIALWKLSARRNQRPEINIIKTSDENNGNGPVFEVIGDCYINPFDGYVISNGHVIWESMTPNYDPAANVSAIGVPKFSAYRDAKAGKSKTVSVPKALHCRHFFEWNYYHFFMDVLSKVSVYESAGVSMQAPLVVGKYFDQLSFAPQTISETKLNKYTWQIQNDSFVHADRVQFCHVHSDFKSRMAWINSQITIDVDQTKEERIYVTRGKCTGRRVKNEPEIIEVMKSFGFKVVDTNGLHILKQVELFRNARFVVAPHGAGITNILFRDQSPLSLLELHPYTQTTDFQSMCKECGYYWSYIKGNADSKDVQHADYWLDPSNLATKVEALLLT